MKFFRNRTLLGVLCILLSLAICFGITPLFNSAISEKTTIVRVKEDIKTGEKISEDMLEVAEVGGYNLPTNIIRKKENIVGRYALADLFVGDYVLTNKISETMQAENAYLYNLDGSKQAMSVTIQDFANGLSGKLESGDIVSVIAADYKKQGVTVIPPELKYVEVISVTADSGSDSNTGEEIPTEEEKELPSTVTVLVTPEQSRILAELEADGIVHISLVYRGDMDNAKIFLGLQDEMLAEIYEENESNDSEPAPEDEEVANSAVQAEDVAVDETDEPVIAENDTAVDTEDEDV